MQDKRKRKTPLSRWAIAAMVIVLSEQAAAKSLQFNKTALAGKTTLMHQYGSWGRNCEPKGGVVKVLTKPQHGRLSSSQRTSIARTNRYNSNDPCLGKPFKAFQVDYTSDANFRGTDTFKIERTLEDGRRDIDTYSVVVR